MKNHIHMIICIFISILFLSSFPSNTSACSCAQSPTAEEEFDRSSAVFSGKVIKMEDKRSLNGSASKTARFEVNNVWKGPSQTQIEISTGLGGGDCGIDFKEGFEYLVYAKESTMYGEKTLVSVICDRTNQLSSSQEDLGMLGVGYPPSEEVDLSDPSIGKQFFLWVTIFIGVAILLNIHFKKDNNKAND
ncbi:hypothetical protein D1B33_08640 [Lysinibacillus yapensis]|uniref:Tissue inhibitor of metalloproteinase n=1 Tax=Ureibacillus yapensis TaxID=2304605 RepID=A0A396S917_9BACL|nr:hypothetical protein [Lysinibacillus yapensis]RHW37585.1 hypothetical protein D1B33_08640 [Lysinibacillus yapensis]